jgi:hypothetical protein
MAGIYQRYILRSDSEANWITLNPKPALNELIYVTDPSIANFKVGDGVNTFSNLGYIGADKYPFKGQFQIGTVTKVHKNEVWEDILSGVPYLALRDFTTSLNPEVGPNWSIFWYVTQDQIAPFAQNRVSRIVLDKQTGKWNRTYYSNVKAAFGGGTTGTPLIPPGSVVITSAPAGDEIYGNTEQVNIAKGCTFNTSGYDLGDPYGYTRPDGTVVGFTHADVITVNDGITTIIGNGATVYVNATGNWGLGQYGAPATLDLRISNLNFESRQVSVALKINGGKCIHTGNISVFGGGSGLSVGGYGVLKSTGDVNVTSGRAFRAFGPSSYLTHTGSSRVVAGGGLPCYLQAGCTIKLVGGSFDYSQHVGSHFDGMAGTLILQDVTVIDNGTHIGLPASSTAVAKIYLRGETVYNVTTPVPAGLTIIDERVGGAGAIDQTNIVHRTGDETIAGIKNFTSNVGVGTATPTSPLTVAGLVESTSGGVKFPDGSIQISAAKAAESDTFQNFKTRFLTGTEIPLPGVTYTITGRADIPKIAQIIEGPLDSGDGTNSGFSTYIYWYFSEMSPGGNYQLYVDSYYSPTGHVEVKTTAGVQVLVTNDYSYSLLESDIPRGAVRSYVISDYAGHTALYNLTMPHDGTPVPKANVSGEFYVFSGRTKDVVMNFASQDGVPGQFRYSLLSDTLTSGVTLEQTLTSYNQNAAPSVYAVATALGYKAPIDSPSFTGIPTTPTPYYTDHSTRIASTQFVYDLLGQNAVVYRTGYPPTPMYVNLGVFSGDTTPHDLMEIRGMFGNLYLRYQDYNLHGYNAVVNNVWIVDGGPGRKITVHGVTSKGNWYIHESVEDGTGIGLVANINYCTIPILTSFQARNGGYRDKHTFTYCKIGILTRSAAYNGNTGHTLNFDNCSFGEGVTSGYLVGDFQPGEMTASFNNCVFRLSGTAQVGPPNPVNSYYPNLQFHNCTVINADGTGYRLDNSGATEHRITAAVTFTGNAEYNPITSGTFTVDDTRKTIGSVVTIYLGTAATEPVIPATGYKKISGSFTAGANQMYEFKVGANGLIRYTITNLDL